MVSIMKQTRDCIENRSMVRLESPVQLFLLVVYIIVLSTTELREFLTNLRNCVTLSVERTDCRIFVALVVKTIRQYLTLFRLSIKLYNMITEISYLVV